MTESTKQIDQHELGNALTCVVAAARAMVRTPLLAGMVQSAIDRSIRAGADAQKISEAISLGIRSVESEG